MKFGKTSLKILEILFMFFLSLFFYTNFLMIRKSNFARIEISEKREAVKI